MAFTVAPSADGKYLVCRVSGLLNQELGKAFAVELERMGRELGISRYLIDVRDAVNTLTPLGNYEYAYNDLPELNIRRDSRVAALVAEDDKSHDFVEIVMRNAGYNLHIFRDETEAMGWLLG